MWRRLLCGSFSGTNQGTGRGRKKMAIEEQLELGERQAGTEWGPLSQKSLVLTLASLLDSRAT